MDYTIANNRALFDRLINVLARHQEDPGVGEAMEGLKLAKANYVQRSLDHMLNNLVLVMYDLTSRTLSPELQSELRQALQGYVSTIFDAPAEMSKLAHQYEAEGGTLLSSDEILRLGEEQRGITR